MSVEVGGRYVVWAFCLPLMYDNHWRDDALKYIAASLMILQVLSFSIGTKDWDRIAMTLAKLRTNGTG